MLAAGPGVSKQPDAAQSDPYIWLEPAESPRALDWVRRENVGSLAALQGDPHYRRYYSDALDVLRAEDRIPSPTLVGGKVVNFWRDEAHRHGIWRIAAPDDYDSATPGWRTLIDLDALSAAEARNWVWKGANCEPWRGSRCLVALSDGGEDATTLREFDVEQGRFVEDGFILPRSRQNVAWVDRDTLAVARDWGNGTVAASGYPFVLKLVTRGKPLAEAREVFRGSATDEVGVSPFTVVDGKGMTATLFEHGITFYTHATYALVQGEPRRVALPAKSLVSGLVAGQLIVTVDEPWNGVAAGSIVSLDLPTLLAGKAVAPKALIVPGPRQMVRQLLVTRNHVVASVFDNVRAHVEVFAFADRGWNSQRLALPDNSTIALNAASILDDRGYLTVTGYLTPDTLWAFDAASGQVRTVKAIPPRFDASKSVVEQLDAVSSDGTRIPYFIVRPRGAVPKGGMPTILTGYGGFQVSNVPVYDGVLGKLWIERGGSYVVANIRGGGEFGPNWHQAVIKARRQLVYDDFTAVARDLVKRGLTSPSRLGIMGGSNGGLLMGVSMTQHPELWRAISIRVPLLDMMRYEKIAAGASWVGEYGSVTVPAERAFLEHTSPYGNLRKGMKYPVPFLWTTSKDDRVGPGHARKFAARLKALGYPYLYYENMAGGHSGDADLEQLAERNAMQMIYFAQRLMPASTSQPVGEGS